MSYKLAPQIDRFLLSLGILQDRLGSLYSQRKTALVDGNLDQLKTCQSEEEKITSQLQQLLQEREAMIQEANRNGFSGTTLREVVVSTSESLETLIARIEQAEKRMAELRQESWVQWIIANRNLQYVSDVISLIANGGKSPMTYDGDEAVHSSGGSLLDASA